jgi:1-acyl-sn-glycerol-3-phosphate acyltransferase
MSEPWGKPLPYRGAWREAVRYLSWAFLALCGWKLHGDWPPLKKAILVAAPHTSNWDALYMLATASYYRVSLLWMGKLSLTRGPFGWLMTALGCVPIDRSARHDVVATMRDAFAARDEFTLLVPPEGTRSKAAWKSGFYYIARGAGVPLILGIMDYRTRIIRIDGVFHTTGNYDADLAAIQRHYRSAVGKYPAKFAAEN